MGKPLTAEQLKKRSRKDVDLPDGTTVVISRLSPARLMAASGGLLDLAALGKDELKKATRADPAHATKALTGIEDIVQAGVVEPALAKERTPDGPPVAADFTIDEQFLLFQEILAFSGYTKEAAQAIRP